MTRNVCVEDVTIDAFTAAISHTFSAFSNSQKRRERERERCRNRGVPPQTIKHKYLSIQVRGINKNVYIIIRFFFIFFLFLRKD